MDWVLNCWIVLYWLIDWWVDWLIDWLIIYSANYNRDHDLNFFIIYQCYSYVDVITMIPRRTWAVHWGTGIHSLLRNCSRFVFTQGTTFNFFNKGFFLFLASSSAIKMFSRLKSRGGSAPPPIFQIKK